MGSVFKNVRMYDLVYLFCYYVKEVNPSSHVGTCLNILMNACRVKGMHHTLCIYMRHTEEAVTVCTTWEQHHTAHEAMWIPQRLPLLAPPFLSHHSQWASQCLPASLYLSNPLRLDPTPPTAPTQSDNPIRTHGQLTSRDAESMFAYRLEIRNVRAHKWDKKDAFLVRFKMQIHAREWYCTHWSSFNASRGTEYYGTSVLVYKTGLKSAPVCPKMKNHSVYLNKARRLCQ